MLLWRDTGVIPHRDRSLSDVSVILLMKLGFRFGVGGLDIRIKSHIFLVGGDIFESGLTGRYCFTGQCYSGI